MEQILVNVKLVKKYCDSLYLFLFSFLLLLFDFFISAKSLIDFKEFKMFNNVRIKLSVYLNFYLIIYMFLILKYIDIK